MANIKGSRKTKKTTIQGTNAAPRGYVMVPKKAFAKLEQAFRERQWS